MAIRIFIDHIWQDGSKTHCEIQPELLLDTDQLHETKDFVVDMFRQSAALLLVLDEVDIDEPGE